jgi:hypothetical protein
MTANSNQTSLTRRLRKLVGGLALATTAFAGVGASSADAAVTTSSGATGSTWFSCNPNLHTINYQVTMSPERGRSTQTASFQLWVYSYTTGQGFWTTPTRVTAPSQNILFVSLPFSAGTNNYRMYVRYSWWNGRAWVVAGEWITTHTQQTLYGGHYQQGYCRA